MARHAVIEQAKGIIMVEQRCGADDAFAVLNRISRNTHRDVRDVAEALVDGIELPTDPAFRRRWAGYPT